MDKLKYIKLENEDGSYSNSIPLAVDSDYVDVNGNTLTEELVNKATNIQINNLQSEINGLASGSPLVASSTSGMTDTSRVYVNTSDGKWYYYDGTSWEIGGTYQSAEDSQTVTLLNDLISNNNLNLYNKSLSQLGYINAGTGQPTYNTTTSYFAKVPVLANTTYYLYRKCEKYNKNDVYSFYNDNTLISFHKPNNVCTFSGHNFLKITTPVNCNYLLFNTKSGENLFDYDEINTTVLSKYIAINSLLGNDLLLRNYLNSYHNSFINLYNEQRTTYFGQYLANDGIKTTNPNSQFVEIPVTAGNTYYLYRESHSYNINGERIYFKEINSNVISNPLIPSDLIVSIGNIELLKITVPSGCDRICFNEKIGTLFDDINKTVFSEYFTSQQTIGTDKELRDNLQNFIGIKYVNNLIGNDLSNKKWLIIGDSLSTPSGSVSIHYFDYIKEKTNITLINKAVGGRGYVTKANTKNICDIVDELDSTDNYDYITIFAGTNDITKTLGNNTSTNKNEIYGAIKYCVENLISKFPNARIGLITPTPRAGAFGDYYGTFNNNILYQISNAVVEVADNYSIPSLNLYKNSSLRPWNATNNYTYFLHSTANPNGDGLHPNELGQELLSVKILDWLRII